MKCFEQELAALKQRVLEMGTLAESVLADGPASRGHLATMAVVAMRMLGDALGALEEEDPQKAQAVMHLDDGVDALWNCAR